MATKRRPRPAPAEGARVGAMVWLLSAVPMYLIWYAEQPWPGGLVGKQLALDLLSALLLGVVASRLLREPGGGV